MKSISWIVKEVWLREGKTLKRKWEKRQKEERKGAWADLLIRVRGETLENH